MNFECAIRPDVTLCGWLDVKIQEVTLRAHKTRRHGACTCSSTVHSFSCHRCSLFKWFYIISIMKVTVKDAWCCSSVIIMPMCRCNDTRPSFTFTAVIICIPVEKRYVLELTSFLNYGTESRIALNSRLKESSGIMNDTAVKTVEEESVKQLCTTPRQNSVNQSQTWQSCTGSKHKEHNTVKSLLAITPNGMFLWHLIFERMAHAASKNHRWVKSVRWWRSFLLSLVLDSSDYFLDW